MPTIKAIKIFDPCPNYYENELPCGDWECYIATDGGNFHVKIESIENVIHREDREDYDWGFDCEFVYSQTDTLLMEIIEILEPGMNISCNYSFFKKTNQCLFKETDAQLIVYTGGKDLVIDYPLFTENEKRFPAYIEKEKNKLRPPYYDEEFLV